MSPEEEYVRLTNSLLLVKTQLGLGDIKWWTAPETNRIVIEILEYISRTITLSGTSTIEQSIVEFSGIYETGTQKIIDEELPELLLEIGVDTTDQSYREERFVLVWGNLMTSIWTCLRYNYPVLTDDSEECSCTC